MEVTMTREPVQRGTYTIKGTASILGISDHAAYSFVKEEHFKGLHIGTAIRIPMPSFDRRFLDNEII